MHVLIDVAAALLALVGYLGWCHISPYRDCPWCTGERPILPRPFRKRCWRCNRTRLTRRWGAWFTHKLNLALREAWADRRGASFAAAHGILSRADVNLAGPVRPVAVDPVPEHPAIAPARQVVVNIFGQLDAGQADVIRRAIDRGN